MQEQAKKRKRKKSLESLQRQQSNRFVWHPGNVSCARVPQFAQRLLREHAAVSRTLQDAMIANGGTVFGSIADIGCGFGRLAPTLEMFADSVVGFERESDMVRVAQELNPASVFTRVNTLRTLPAPDLAFDLSMSFTVLQHMSTSEAALVLREMARITSRYILLVEDTNPHYSYTDSANKSHFTIGRPVGEYSTMLPEFSLIRIARRDVEHGFRYRGKPRPYVGHYMLFERRR